jgi:hypothetical protein
MERKELEGLSREELIGQAEQLGVVRPRTLTIPELVDEILVVSAKRASEKRQRGWFGRARDLLTSVIDRGLALPEPGRTSQRRPSPPAPPPLPTVTLAEIYAAQGHLERAITTLDEVLAREPSHSDARDLKARFEHQLHKTKPSTPPPVIEARLETMPPPAPISDLDRLTPASAEVRPEPERADAESPSDGAEPREVADASLVEAPKAPSIAPIPLKRPSTPPVHDVDDIVGLAVDPHTIYLYWEVRPATLAHARAKDDSGALTVRAATVLASLEGPETDVRDFRVDALSGELFVHGLPSQANVRISVGYKTDTDFEPFAVGIDLSTPRESASREVATTFRRWSEASRAAPTPPPADPVERALSMRRARALPDYGAEGSEALLAKFPSDVWVDPSTRVVRVVGTDGPPRQGSDVTSHTFVMRKDGSSELFRRNVVWASNPSVWASSVGR